MGGGASSIQSVENLLATTMMLGRAIAAITFPGMYRIYDFHSKKAPKFKNSSKNFTLFGYVSDDDDGENTEEIDPSIYSHFFHVQVGNDIIYLEDPTASNDAGWTSLHACCMSPSTINAGIQIINEFVRRGVSLDIKTIAGPGTFNKGWTPLHMACAYGIEPIVEKLVDEGAAVNTTNSFGFSPLYEACHRGYIGIVTHLLKARNIDLNYIPDDSCAQESPFISAPPQSALGEASRAGFHKIVQMLLDAGADKNLRNAIGWTPLHEACFYNRIDTVKVLLLSGANPCARTKIGALPYHLAGFQVLKSMIVDMGGPEAAPKEGDVIDMVTVLKEMTLITDDDNDEYDGDNGKVNNNNVNHESVKVRNESHSHVEDTPSSSPKKLGKKSKVKKQYHDSDSSNNINSNSKSNNNNDLDSKDDDDDDDNDRPQYLHSGPVLGNLPSLPMKIASPTSSAVSPSHKPFGSELDSLLGDSHNRGSILSARSYYDQDVGTNKNNSIPSRKADEKKPKKKKKGEEEGIFNIPEDTPSRYKCQLTQRIMTEPVKSIYGHIYEKSAIMSWLNQQGRICPLTGAPLSEINLKPMEELSGEIRNWIIKRSLGESDNSSNHQDSSYTSTSVTNASINSNIKIVTSPTDDLYDF